MMMNGQLVPLVVPAVDPVDVKALVWLRASRQQRHMTQNLYRYSRRRMFVCWCSSSWVLLGATRYKFHPLPSLDGPRRNGVSTFLLLGRDDWCVKNLLKVRCMDDELFGVCQMLDL